MAKRRKVGNLLALAILATLAEKPRHPYEMASVMRERSTDSSIKIRWGSLYTVVQNLEKHAFIQATGTTRQGSRPERTVYSVTEAGRAELGDWLTELIGTPEPELTRFEAGLTLLGILPPDRAQALLAERARVLDEQIAIAKAGLASAADVPRIFLVEAEFRIAMTEAEAHWVRSLLTELETGSLPGLDMWRQYHAGTPTTPDWAEWAEKGTPTD
ncbi:MAG: PadR family transcriptional regulator [Actinomycetia bacterium]|jgi:DNA-binding PadR family transcriptional regulator|nr:PadR family transcriptional regulator [Actinomycetes bacterium]